MTANPFSLVPFCDTEFAELPPTVTNEPRLKICEWRHCRQTSDQTAAIEAIEIDRPRPASKKIPCAEISNEVQCLRVLVKRASERRNVETVPDAFAFARNLPTVISTGVY